MKIAQLHLLSFGPFTDRHLNLAQTNFNLIYGPNEAGKSSSLRAILALLYGIPAKTADDFVHRYPDLRVGARLVNSEGCELSFARRKKTKGSLVSLDDSEKILAENVLDDFLRGTERKRFCDIHCIDHAQFREGGRLMLELQGLADDSLLAASSSMNFPALQADLRAQIADLYASRKPTSQLLKAKKRYDELRTTKKDLEVHVHRWQTLHETVLRLEEEKTAVDNRRTALRAEEIKLTQMLGALPKIAEWKRCNDELRGQSLTTLPESYDVEARRDCEKQWEVIDANLEQNEKRFNELQAEAAEIAESPELLAHAAQIEHLQQRIGAQLDYRDLCETKRRELDLAEREVKRLLTEVDADAPFERVEQWRLSREQRSTIRRLANEEKELRERNRRLQTSLAETIRQIELLENQQRESPPLSDTRVLETEIGLAKRSEGLEEEISRQQTTLGKCERRAEQKLASLPFWHGSLDELTKAKLPLTETISSFDSQFVLVESQLRQSKEGLEETRSERTKLQEQITADQRATSLVTEDDLQQARELRQQGWQLLRRSWRDGEEVDAEIQEYAGTQPLEQAYESHVDQADTVADRLRREADRVAKLSQQIEQERGLAERVVQLEEAHTALLQRERDLQSEWSQQWNQGGVTDVRTPREMAKWLEHRAEILAHVREMVELRQQVSELQACHDRACEQLQACLREYGVTSNPKSLSRLLGQAESHFDELVAMHRQREQCDVELERLRGVRERVTLEERLATQELQQWQKGWSGAMEWIRCGVETTAVQASARLETLEELSRQYEEWKQLQRKLTEADASAARFAEDVAAISKCVDIDGAERSPVELAQYLKQSLDAAQTMHQDALRVRRDIEKLNQQISEQKRQRQALNQQLQQFLSTAGVGSREELLEVEMFSKRSAERNAIEQDIRGFADGVDFEEFLRQTQGKDAAELQARKEQVCLEFHELEQKRDDLKAQINAAETEMASMDGNDAYARADQMAMNGLSHIHEIAGRYVRLMIAESILRQQIERYREENKDPLLAKASEFFAAMTCYEFLGLQVDYDEKTGKPVIVGIRSENRKRMNVAAMSDGTRDPLFLSLRLAYLERRLGAYEPMPFIVDDILIHLDDQRALATLRVLLELSQQMQVLFFTHHDRLRELAEKHLPADKITIHELAKPALI